MIKFRLYRENTFEINNSYQDLQNILLKETKLGGKLLVDIKHIHFANLSFFITKLKKIQNMKYCT